MSASSGYNPPGGGGDDTFLDEWCYVRNDGDDGTAVIGNPNKPFETAQAAWNANIAFTSIKLDIGVSVSANIVVAAANSIEDIYIRGAGSGGAETPYAAISVPVLSNLNFVNETAFVFNFVDEGYWSVELNIIDNIGGHTTDTFHTFSKCIVSTFDGSGPNGVNGVNGGIGTAGAAGSEAVGLKLYDSKLASCDVSGGNGGNGGNSSDPDEVGGAGGASGKAGIFEAYRSHIIKPTTFGGNGGVGGTGDSAPGTDGNGGAGNNQIYEMCSVNATPVASPAGSGGTPGTAGSLSVVNTVIHNTTGFIT